MSLFTYEQMAALQEAQAAQKRLEDFIANLKSDELEFSPEVLELARRAFEQRGRPFTQADIDRLAAEAAECRD